MNNSVLRLMTGTILIIGVFGQTQLAYAKVKSTEGKGQATIAWLNKSEVSAFLNQGAFWCMQPDEGTCSFSAEVTFSDRTNFVYLVTSVWDDGILFKEYYDAYVRDDGTLCEPALVNFDRMGWTDLNGVPVNAEVLELYKTELSDWFGPEEKPDRCFRYGYSEPNNSQSLTQYSISESGEFIEPIRFLVTYSANASGAYSLHIVE